MVRVDALGQTPRTDHRPRDACATELYTGTVAYGRFGVASRCLCAESVGSRDGLSINHRSSPRFCGP
jgi:hypothetical protein